MCEDPYQDDAGLNENATLTVPVLDTFKRDIDFTLLEKNLRLTLEERAQQLSNITQFLRKFRPLINKDRS